MAEDVDKPTLSPRKLVYQNKYQEIYKIDANFGDFSKEFFVLSTGEKAGVVACRNQKILLVRQYRLLINDYSWEIPGGKVDPGESPSEAAIRECVEETGVRCIDLQPLIYYQPGLDTSDNPTHLFYTEQAAAWEDKSKIHTREVDSCDWFPIADCLEMVYSQRIIDSFSVIAILAYANRVSKATTGEGS